MEYKIFDYVLTLNVIRTRKECYLNLNFIDKNDETCENEEMDQNDPKSQTSASSLSSLKKDTIGPK